MVPRGPPLKQPSDTPPAPKCEGQEDSRKEGHTCHRGLSRIKHELSDNVDEDRHDVVNRDFEEGLGTRLHRRTPLTDGGFGERSSSSAILSPSLWATPRDGHLHTYDTLGH